jgi:putative PIN family toxin of toxin-antitoxin system
VPESATSPLIRAWRTEQFELVLSEHIVDEVQHTLAGPYFSRFLTATDQELAIAAFRRFATIVPITAVVEGVATHPEDDLVLATAVSGQVDYLVTLDQQLLRLGTYQGVRIVSTREFLIILQAEGDA